MARTVTSKDVARIAGVSQSTVSYVMSGKRPISEKTRRVVEDAIAELTYQPHAGARALASHRSQIVAVVMPFDSTLGAQGLMDFVEEITLAARQRDHDVLMVTAEEGVAGLQRVAGRKLCDAIVLMEVRTDDPRVQIARELDLPTLFIGVPADTEALHCIDFDFEHAARLLVSELAEAGNRRIAALGWGADVVERDINYVPRFRSAAQDEAARRGVDLTWTTADRDLIEQQIEQQVVGALAVPGTGLLLAHQLTRAVHGLQENGWRPGVDVDVVALGTHAQATAFPVPLTAVSPQPRDVSRRAMDWLFALLDDPRGESGVRRVPAALVRRASVRSR